MSKCNKEAIIKLCNDINKKEGEGAVYSIGSKHANLKINRWSTGIEDLDAIIGGGMPEGRVVEICVGFILCVWIFLLKERLMQNVQRSLETDQSKC